MVILSNMKTMKMIELNMLILILVSISIGTMISEMDEHPVVSPMPRMFMPNSADVDQLMMLMVEGTRKIEAIKIYRQLTGFELKESKDAVEKYWVARCPDQ